MSKYGKVALLVFGMAWGGSVPASAATITWDLACVISSGACTASSSWGTLELEDVANGDVMVTLTLANPTARIQQFALNYDLAIAWDPPPANNTNDLEFQGGTPGVLVDADSITADGYGSFFDVQIPDVGNLGNVSSFTGTLFRSGGGDITIDNFMFTTGPASLFAAVHIGNINAQGDSIWVGTTGDGGGDSDGVTPEPAMLGLFGLGLALAAGRLRKRAR